MFEFHNNADGFEELRLSVIPQAIEEVDNKENPETFAPFSPERGKEIILEKEDYLNGQFSTIKQNSR